MVHTRRLAGILAAVIVSICLCGGAAAQAPDLTRQQRELLQTIITAVDAAGNQTETADASWQSHLLRASDGSHYVAFTLTPPPSMPISSRASALYVRLASVPATSGRVERSPLKEWLAGRQAAPPPSLVARAGIAFGEMPIMGPAGSIERRPPQTPEMANLALMDLERRRTRERQEERDRQRRAELDGRASTPSEILPFEDFDLSMPARRTIQRALTAGPGDYFLYVAWAETGAAESRPAVHVVKRRLALPPATSDALTVGSIILADRIDVRQAVYAPTEQASHPYTIGLTEIVPAGDATFSDAEHLSAVFQVINARPDNSGKPNIDVTLQIVDAASSTDRVVATLTPQNYSAANLPANFDLRSGHPLFASVSAPLTTLKRGSYRLKVVVSDKVAGTGAAADVTFSVTATTAALLREAPSLGLPFDRDVVLVTALPQLLTAIRPATLSPTLQRAFELASSRRFVELMVEEPVAANEDGVRAVLRGLAHLAMGDASAAAVQFQRAQLLGAPVATTRLLSGAARAAQLRDADAIAAWQEALAASGSNRPLITALMIDAHLRRNDAARAASLLGNVTITAQTPWSRSLAAVLIASQKEDDAIRLLEPRLAATPGDRDAQWLMLHALFAKLTREPVAAPARARFLALARSYIDAKGANAAIAEDWLKAISSV